MKVPLLSAIRWGGRAERQLDGGVTVEVDQFVDLALLAPQQLSLALYATASAPVAGLSVEWTLRLGNGSISHAEVLTVPVSDVASQAALVLHRPAKTVQVTARIINVGAPARVTVDVLIAPTSPTWVTDVVCDVPVRDAGSE